MLLFLSNGSYLLDFFFHISGPCRDNHSIEEQMTCLTDILPFKFHAADLIRA